MPATPVATPVAGVRSLAEPFLSQGALSEDGKNSGQVPSYLILPLPTRFNSMYCNIRPSLIEIGVMLQQTILHNTVVRN